MGDMIFVVSCSSEEVVDVVTSEDAVSRSILLYLVDHLRNTSASAYWSPA